MVYLLYVTLLLLIIIYNIGKYKNINDKIVIVIFALIFINVSIATVFSTMSYVKEFKDNYSIYIFCASLILIEKISKVIIRKIYRKNC